jgi:putative MATE family efflux protein
MRKPALLRLPSQDRRGVFGMVAPVLLEQTLISTMGVIGMVLASRLGSEAVTPIGMVDAVHNLFILLFTSLGAGATVVVSQNTGRGEMQHANEAARQAMASSLVVAGVLVVVLFFTGVPLVDLLYGTQTGVIRRGVERYLLPTLLSYPPLAVVTVGCGVLRGTGDTRTPMKITVFMGALNAVLSALLIYGLDLSFLGLAWKMPALGLQGAALAILISRLAAAVLIGYVMFKGQRNIHISVRGFRFLPAIQKEILDIGIPVTMESALFQIGKLLTIIVVVSCGPAEVNGNIIANSIFSLVCIPGNAFAIAAMPLVGQCVGRGDYEGARDRLLFVNWLSSLGIAATCALMTALAWPLAYLFTTDAIVARKSVEMLWVVAVFMPLFWSVSFVLPAGLKGAGDTRYSLVTSVIGMWAFRVLLGYVLGITLGLGAVGVYLGMCIDWVVRGILYYIRLRGKRWYARVQREAAVAYLNQNEG